MKKNYEALEGLRGVAAIVVLIFHYCEVVYYPNYEDIPLGHGYLSVDFFFCLSGFIIAFAYSERIKTVGIKRFMINRLIRLHPMVIMGIILGVASYLINPYVKSSGNYLQMGIAILCSLFLIPYTKLPFREGELFPYNTPLWSLYLEYIINIVFACVLCRIKKKSILLIIGMLSAIWLLYCAQRSGWIINGWSVIHWDDGFARVVFSFIAGMLVYRLKWVINNKTGLWILVILLFVLSFPHSENDWILECIFVIVCFPVIVSLGAGTSLKGTGRKVCLFLGKLSYPLYIIHFASVSLFSSYYFSKNNDFSPQGIKLFLIITLLVLINMLFAYLILRFYDEPVRKKLSRN